jgi:hypothetical protein
MKVSSHVQILLQRSLFCVVYPGSDLAVVVGYHQVAMQSYVLQLLSI